MGRTATQRSEALLRVMLYSYTKRKAYLDMMQYVAARIGNIQMVCNDGTQDGRTANRRKFDVTDKGRNGSFVLEV
eukprot:12202442-Ditylum_brightwellii.AAC.1